MATAAVLDLRPSAITFTWAGRPIIQLPEDIVFLDEIPRTSVGKFKKSRLREMYAGWERKKQASGG